jgi:uncharacterized membrane protein YecN with MAPEG domain
LRFGCKHRSVAGQEEGHMPLVTSLIIAVALAVINLWLSIRTGQARQAAKVSVGDGDNPLLIARMRAHANFIEYVPMALILMALIDSSGSNSQLLWLLGIALVIGRIIHPFGMERPSPNPFRIGGILLTYLVTIALIVWAVIILVR